MNYDRLVEKAASLRQTLAGYQTGMFVRRDSYIATLEAQYRGRINTLLAHLEIAGKYILQAKEISVREESMVKEKQSVLWVKNKEIHDVNVERFQNKQVGLKNLFFLKQLVLQGSDRHAVHRRFFMAEKMELFQVFSGFKSKANDVADRLTLLKDEGKPLVAEERVLQEKKEMLLKKDQERKAYKSYLVDQIAMRKKRRVENCVKLETQKEKIVELKKESFQLQEHIDSPNKPRAPRRSLGGGWPVPSHSDHLTGSGRLAFWPK
eukprot:gene20580-22606_t